MSDWLLLLHQLPAEPPGLRVRIWRRLQAVGALSLKNAVYLLPASDAAREDFEWIAREVRAAGAEASLWQASAVEGVSDAELVARFQAAVAAEYLALEKALAKATKSSGKKRKALAPAERARLHTKFRNEFQAIGRRDFFQAPRREVVGALLDALDPKTAEAAMYAPPPLPRAAVADYRGTTWVTRADVRVDRLASAWLIRRFIDPDARFRFVRDKAYQPATGEARFDMYEGEFTHEGELCTFEALIARFGLAIPGLATLAEIVHDIDLKDGRHGHPETAGVAAMIDGLAVREPDDLQRIEQASFFFDGLVAGFAGRG